MKENVLQRDIIRFCSTNNIYCINIYGSGMTAKGVPDLILCINGKFVAFECKVGNNTPQIDQVINGKRIKKCGGLWFVPYSLDEAITIIKNVKGGYYG